VAVPGALVSAQVYDALATDPKDRVVVRTATLSGDAGAYKLFIGAGTYNLVASKLGGDAPVCAPLAAQVVVVADTMPTQDFSVDALEPAELGKLEGSVSIANPAADAYVTISVRQTVTLTSGEVMIELWSANVQDGGNYSIDLPAGTFVVVATTSGKPTFEATGIAVTAGATTALPIAF